MRKPFRVMDRVTILIVVTVLQVYIHMSKLTKCNTLYTCSLLYIFQLDFSNTVKINEHKALQIITYLC